MLSQGEGGKKGGREGRRQYKGRVEEVRIAGEQSVEGSGVRKRRWRNEMGKEDRGHCGEKQF